MVTILTTTEELFIVEDIINRVDRLNELVHINVDGSVQKGDKVLEVYDAHIKTPIDWFDTEPPYRYPEVPLTETNLLALVFDRLGNHQQAFQLLSEEDMLYPHLLAATHLRFGYEFTEELMHSVRTSMHNEAIVHHYGNIVSKKSFKQLREIYATALQQTTDVDSQSYTAKHYLNLLIDGGLFDEAVEASKAFLKEARSQEAIMALRMQLCNAEFKNLSVPYSTEKLSDLQELQSDCISYLEENGLQLNAALLAMDACDVANFLEDFPKAKEWINKAIQHFKDEDIAEFLGEAGLKKARLLYHWSKNGSPQYYKASINAFQDTLKIFKRELYPEYFAEVQHNLALIYSEIPVTEEEKPIWTAFSASAFKEALSFYGKETRPYEYAMVCHNYATALMDFPPAKLHDNFKKAYELFEEALKIRTAQNYPIERVLTLLNQLELAWLMHNEDATKEGKRYAEMKAKAEEIKTMVQDEDLLAKANGHLEKLEKLRAVI